MSELSDLPVKKLQLRRKTMAALSPIGCETIGDLLSHSPEALRAAGLDDDAISDIAEAAADLDIPWSPADEPPPEPEDEERDLGIVFRRDLQPASALSRREAQEGVETDRFLDEAPSRLEIRHRRQTRGKRVIDLYDLMLAIPLERLPEEATDIDGELVNALSFRYGDRVEEAGISRSAGSRHRTEDEVVFVFTTTKKSLAKAVKLASRWPA